MKLVQRRTILSGLTATVGLELFGPSVSFSSGVRTLPAQVLITGDAASLPIEKPEGYLNKVQAADGKVNVLDIQSSEMKSITVPFFPHGFAFTKDGKRTVACEKWGPTASVISLKTKTIEKLIHAPAGATFFGHACFQNDDRNLILSGQVASGEGAIFIFDANLNWKFTETILIPRKVHEVQALTDHSIAFAVTCHSEKPDRYAAGQGAFQTMDLRNRKQDSFFPVPDASHILKLNDAEFIVSGCIDYTSDLPVSFVNTQSGSTKSIISLPAFKGLGLKGEGLSLAALSADEVLVTVPITKQILIWNYRSDRLVDLKIKDQPLGVHVLNEKEFLVSGLSKTLRKYTYRKADGVITEAEVVANSFGNGRHIYALK